MSSQTEIVKTIGQLVRAERAHLGFSSIVRAAESVGMNYKTLAQLELGRTMPYAANQAKVEEMLMWRSGSLSEAMEQDPDSLSLEWFRDWEKEEPATAAAELTDEALMTEVIKRMDRWRLKLSRLDELEAFVSGVEDAPAPSRKSASGGADFGKRHHVTPAEKNHQNAYDLAAHTPRTGKKVDPRKATRE